MMGSYYSMVMILFLAVSLSVTNAPSATGSLTLKVVDEEGRPVGIAMVQLWIATATGARGFEFAAHPTDVPGAFRVTGIPVGRYQGVKINKSGYAPGWMPDVQVDAGHETPLTCTLSRGGTIEGHVYDETGAPAEGIPIVVNAVHCRRDVITDRTGRFVAEHLALDTRYSIGAEPRADSPYKGTVVRGTVPCGATDIRLVLRRKADASPAPTSADERGTTPRDEDPSLDRPAAASVRSTILAREALVGKAAPALIVERWYHGSFWELDLKNKVVLLDFWGVWCSACRGKLPQIRDLAVKYSEQGLVVIGVHTQSRKEDLPSFLSRNDLPYLVAVDYDNRTAEAYRVAGYPMIALIDRKGILRAVDPRHLEREVVALLAEK